MQIWGEIDLFAKLKYLNFIEQAKVSFDQYYDYVDIFIKRIIIRLFLISQYLSKWCHLIPIALKERQTRFSRKTLTVYLRRCMEVPVV